MTRLITLLLLLTLTSKAQTHQVIKVTEKRDTTGCRFYVMELVKADTTKIKMPRR